MYLIAPCLTILHNHLVCLKLVHLKDVAEKKTLEWITIDGIKFSKNLADLLHDLHLCNLTNHHFYVI